MYIVTTFIAHIVISYINKSERSRYKHTQAHTRTFHTRWQELGLGSPRSEFALTEFALTSTQLAIKG